MAKKDPRIDAYIAKSADFAKPILIHLRKLVHQACPDVEESIKWSRPAFLHHGLLCGMSAFKRHCAFGFWSPLMGARIEKPANAGESMGHFGKITSAADLPKDAVLIGYIRQAAKLNEDGEKRPREKRPKTPLKIPKYFQKTLAANAKAQENFEKFSYSHKKEYVEWITGAKQEETRLRRLEKALQQIAEGKSQNWKYDRREG